MEIIYPEIDMNARGNKQCPCKIQDPYFKKDNFTTLKKMIHSSALIYLNYQEFWFCMFLWHSQPHSPARIQQHPVQQKSKRLVDVNTLKPVESD